MEIEKKQRLIGGIIIVAVIAIFLPLLFHNPHPSAENTETPSQTPLKLPPPEKHTQILSKKASSPVLVQIKKPVTPKNTQPTKITRVAQQHHQHTTSAHQTITTSYLKKPKQHHTAKKTIQKQNQILHKRHNLKKTRHIKSKHPPSIAHATRTQPSTITTHQNINHHRTAHSNLSTVWTLQVASFTQIRYATPLIKKLRLMGFDVYQTTLKHHGKRITRVFVGPNINHQTLYKIQQTIKHQFHLKGIIKKYPYYHVF